MRSQSQTQMHIAKLRKDNQTWNCKDLYVPRLKRVTMSWNRCHGCAPLPQSEPPDLTGENITDASHALDEARLIVASNIDLPPQP